MVISIEGIEKRADADPTVGFSFFPHSHQASAQDSHSFVLSGIFTLSILEYYCSSPLFSVCRFCASLIQNAFLNPRLRGRGHGGLARQRNCARLRPRSP